MDWITPALNRLHQEHQDLAVILAEVLKRQKETNRLLSAEPKLPVPRMDPMKLLQPPYIWAMIALGALGLQIPLPQVIEVMKIAVGAP